MALKPHGAVPKNLEFSRSDTVPDTSFSCINFSSLLISVKLDNSVEPASKMLLILCNTKMHVDSVVTDMES